MREDLDQPIGFINLRARRSPVCSAAFRLPEMQEVQVHTMNNTNTPFVDVHKERKNGNQ